MMQRVKKGWQIIRSRGDLMLIFVLCIALLTWSGYTIVQLNSLVNDLAVATAKQFALKMMEEQLLEQETAVKRYIFLDGNPKYIPELATPLNHINPIFEKVAETLDNDVNMALFLQSFETSQAIIQQDLTALTAAYSADDTAKQNTLATKLLNHPSLSDQMGQLSFLASLEQETLQHQITGKQASVVRVSVIALAIFPFLILYIFVRTSRFATPLFRLNNALVAIEGDIYDSTLLADVADRKDMLGEFGQALNQMTAAKQAHQDQLDQEIVALEEELQAIKQDKMGSQKKTFVQNSA